MRFASGVYPAISLEQLCMNFFFACGEKVEAPYGRPGSLVLWTPESNIVYLGTLSQPEDPVSRNATKLQAEGQDLSEILLPKIEESVTAVEATTTVEMQRHWFFLEKVSALSRSSSGTVVGVGTDGGVVSLWSSWTGTLLHGNCPGHYGAVRSISFCGNARCCTAGADGWMHVVSVDSGALIFRTNTAPTFDGAAGLSSAVCGYIPLTVGVADSGALRLWDTRLSHKIGKLVGAEGSPASAENVILASAYDSFGIFQRVEGQTVVSVYDMNAVLVSLFPGIANRCDGRFSAVKLFRALTSEQRTNPAVERPGGGANKSNKASAAPSALTGATGSIGRASASSGGTKRSSPSRKKASTLTKATLAAHEDRYDFPPGVTSQVDVDGPAQDEWRKAALDRYKKCLAEKHTANKRITTMLGDISNRMLAEQGG
ncbi:unnamed protein product [Amoebophrya sp. A25]|nr:unnamed protein product [Amoebophrya sp. A25]|eukprot:GSA25T00002972001.1